MRNELNQFGYLQPTSVNDAVSLLTQYGGQRKGHRRRDGPAPPDEEPYRATHPNSTSSTSTQLGLNGVTYNSSSGLTIGATTNVSQVMTDPNVNQYYPALAQAATATRSR